MQTLGKKAFTGRSRSGVVVRAATALPKEVRAVCVGARIAGPLSPPDRSSRHGLHVQFKTVKPVGDRVFVKVEEPEARTMGGVLLPTTAQKRPTAGAIVALGDADTVKVGACTLIAQTMTSGSGWRGREGLDWGFAGRIAPCMAAHAAAMPGAG